MGNGSYQLISAIVKFYFKKKLFLKSILPDFQQKKLTLPVEVTPCE